MRVFLHRSHFFSRHNHKGKERERKNQIRCNLIRFKCNSLKRPHKIWLNFMFAQKCLVLAICKDTMQRPGQKKICENLGVWCNEEITIEMNEFMLCWVCMKMKKKAENYKYVKTMEICLNALHSDRHTWIVCLAEISKRISYDWNSWLDSVREHIVSDDNEPNTVSRMAFIFLGNTDSKAYKCK